MLLFALLLFVRNINYVNLYLTKKINLNQRPHQLAFSKDGHFLAVSGEQGALIFSTNDWRRRLTTHEGGFNVISLENDYQFAIVGTNERLQVISPTSEPQSLDLPSLKNGVSNPAFIANRKLLGLCDGNTLKLYNLPTHKLILKKELGSSYPGQMIGADTSLVLSLWGHARLKGGAIQIYTNHAQKPITKRFPFSGPYALAYSPKTKKLYTGCVNGSLYTLDLTGRHMRFLCRPRRQIIQCLSVSPDGSLIAVGYKRDFKRNQGKDGMLVIDSHSGQILTQNEQTVGVESVLFSPDGKTLVQTGRDGNLRIYGY